MDSPDTQDNLAVLTTIVRNLVGVAAVENAFPGRCATRALNSSMTFARITMSVSVGAVAETRSNAASSIAVLERVSRMLTAPWVVALLDTAVR